VLIAQFPNNPGLLGLNYNMGAKICIRLRPHNAPDTFYDLEGQHSLIGTMAHELTHNMRSVGGRCIDADRVAGRTMTSSSSSWTVRR